jgi:hypothetical protein
MATPRKFAGLPKTNSEGGENQPMHMHRLSFMQVRDLDWFRTTHRQADRTWCCTARHSNSDWPTLAAADQGDDLPDKPLHFPGQSHAQHVHNTSTFVLATFVLPYLPPDFSYILCNYKLANQ